MKTILIIEDDAVLSRMLGNWLTKKEVQTKQTSFIATARKIISEQKIDMVLSDLRLPDGDGIEFLKWMRKERHSQPFLLMTSYGQIAGAVEAIKLGAIDYLSKPVVEEQLCRIVYEVLKHKKDRMPTSDNYYQGQSPKTMELRELLTLVAVTDMSVLLRGASGTGKEYAAHYIHMSSERADKPYVTVDCGAIPKELAASEFFGHVRGAFTGATDNKDGVLLEADGGTLFLDEIGNLSYEVQMMLLRALQEKRFRPVGGKKDIEVDVRIIAATNENLENAIQEERFREDLFHRINEFTIHIPSLSECPEDIVPMAEFFLKISCRKLKKQLSGFDKLAEAMLRAYSWPGNIREMQHLVNRATLLAKGERITPHELNLDLNLYPAKDARPVEDNQEKEVILNALRNTGGNRSRAAALLNISRSTFYEKMKKYEIEE